MDIQKEREAFESYLKKMGKTDNETFSKNEDDSYQMDIIHFGWKIWQSAIARMEVRINTLDEMLLNQGEALAQAKAQAVPEGFVLVEKAKLMQIIGSVSMIEPITRGNPYMDSVKRELTAITDVVKTVIKAQELAK